MDVVLSVIVPVYNVEKYLKRCVDSILAQTCEGMEIILVDDGSVDECGGMCDKYAENDARIRVVHKVNGGLVSARKVGLHAARGQFIGWVDGDDWVEPGYFNQMLQMQSYTGADIITSDHFHDIGEDSKRIKGCFAPGTYTKEQLLPRLMYAGAFFTYGIQPHVWSKIFRKDILEKVQAGVDDRIVAGEDAAVVYPSIVEAEKICITGICGYHYVQNDSSITKTGQADEVERAKLLFGHLQESFIAGGVWGTMRCQMEQYKKYFLFMRQMSVFDPIDGQVLLPYGGIPRESRVILYGAGGLGQKLYQYLSGIGGMEIVMWADKNAAAYARWGMGVEESGLIRGVKAYDYVLIANTVVRAAKEIMGYLESLGVPGSRIKWFTDSFIQEDMLICRKS